MCCVVNKYVVRQFMLLAAICLYSFATGIILAFPSVFNPAILDPNADIKATPNQASWIAACHGFAGLLGFAVLSPTFDFFGRKTTNIIMDLFILLGSIMFYIANDVYAIVFARLAQGLSAGGTFTSAIALCECSSPRRRGYYMILNKLSLALGSLVCHALGLILNWKQIAIIGAVPTSISIIIFSICRESPSFYAIQGQFDKCAETFQWYRGTSSTARKELKDLIVAQTENLEMRRKEKNTSVFKRTKSIMMTKDFRRSFFIVTLATLCLDSCGRYFLLAYMTQIMKEITNDTNFSMYMSVVFDCILLISLFISCFIIKRFNRRTLLFKLGFCSAFCMFMVSLFKLLTDKLTLLQNVKWLMPTIILLHTFITNIGLVPTAFALTGEIFSLEHRGVGSFVSGVIFITFYTVVIKLTPMMIDSTGVEGTYSIYGSCLFICLVLLAIVLPETKDKTLQDIENELKGTVRNNSDTDLLKYSKLIVASTE